MTTNPGQVPLYAKVAVSSITFGIDRPYDYKIPQSIADQVKPGVRVIVPYGVNNRKTEAMVLQLSEETEYSSLKEIIRVLDDEPILSREMIQLLLRVRDLCFCTFYDVLKTAIPAGLWFNLEQKLRLAETIDPLETKLLGEQEKAVIERLDKSLTIDELEKALGFDPAAAVRCLTENGIIEKETAAIRGVGDKTIRIASLAVSIDEAEDYIAKNSKRAPYHARILEFLVSTERAAEKEIEYFTGCGRASIRRLEEKGLILLEEQEVMRRPEVISEAVSPNPIVLNSEQKEAVKGLISLYSTGESAVALLHGVTGSGKTHIYMSVIEHVLERERQALVLVPEIALTPQLMRIFQSRFGGDRVAILHSMLSAGERADEWKRIRRGQADIVLGTRSAAFAPLSNIGVIVIDEEQEHTYKSENTPRYHARDVLKYRAYYNNALLILASATPSIESYYSAKSGVYHLFNISERYNKSPLPEVLIADMRKELADANSSTISSVLKDEMVKNIKNGEQTILFLNRRGNSRRLVCGECGAIPECKQCSNAMTYHSANGRLMCHLCGFSHIAEDRCYLCGGEFKFVGAGTQKCEEDLKELFPDIEVLRMDSDTTAPKRSHEEILKRFREEKIPVLLGTQMIAKGLDFENVTLVGVIDADQSLYAEDYRSHEKTFSLITQVVGRAGRGRKPGRAVLQTFTPENPILLAAVEQDYETFYREEIQLRERLCTPPFCEILLLTVSSVYERKALNAALQTAKMLREMVLHYGFEIQVLGPTQAPVFRLRGSYRFQITLTTKNSKAAIRLVTKVIKDFRKNRYLKDCSISADFKPNGTN